MAARRRTRKVTRRAPKSVNLLNLGTDLIQADAVTRLFSNTGLWGFFVKPWTRKDAFGPEAIDNALDMRELFYLLQGVGLSGGMTRYTGGEFVQGRSPATEGGLASIFMENIRDNAVQTIGTIAGVQIFKRFMRSKWGLTRPMNKLLKTAGIKEVKF